MGAVRAETKSRETDQDKRAQSPPCWSQGQASKPLTTGTQAGHPDLQHLLGWRYKSSHRSKFQTTTVKITDMSWALAGPQLSPSQPLRGPH